MAQKREKTAHSKGLVDEVQKDHRLSFNLITQFREALSSRKKKEAEKILGRLDEALARHFDFEVSYLYPRMRRLILEITDRLCARQERIKNSIKEAQHLLNRDNVGKDKLSTITDALEMISSHLGDCAGIVSLANNFCKEEKDELGQRFKEFGG